MGKEAKGYFLKNGYADLLRRHGYHVLVFDLNGFGESTQGSFWYHEDIIAVGNKALELTPGLPLGYLGISLGGAWAAVAFADARHPYDFAVIESACASQEEFWRNYPRAYRTLRLMRWLLPGYAQTLDMAAHMRKARGLRSVLLIYSEADSMIPVEMGRRFQAASCVPAELWLVPGGQHAQLMKSPSRRAYEAKLLDYFDRAVQQVRA